MFAAVIAASTRLMTMIAVLAICGIAVSSVSLQRHYASSKTQFCDVGETFNCDIVNRSEYSKLFGIPVALIGMLGYGLIAGLATVYRSRAETPKWLFGFAGAGMAFALYLTYIEGFVIGIWCILCLGSLTLIALIAILSAVVWQKRRAN